MSKHLHKILCKHCSDNDSFKYNTSAHVVDEVLIESISEWLHQNNKTIELGKEVLGDTIFDNRCQHWYGDQRTKAFYTVRSLLYELVQNEIGNAVLNHNGKFNIRLRNTLRSKYHVTCLTNDDYCKISTIIGDWKESNRLEYEFTDTFDWDSGDYGDDGSCFWGDRAAARDTLEHYNALAILFYKDENGNREGVGRAWIAPILHRANQDGAVVVFNRYGVPRQMEEVVDAIKKIDKDIYATHVHLTNRGTSSSTLYANGDAFVLSYEPYPYNELDLKYNIVRGRYDEKYNYSGYYCEHCGDPVDEDDGYFVCDNMLCQSCYDERCGTCEHCNENFYNEDLHTLSGGGYVCDNCISRHGYYQCVRCEDYVHYDDTFETTDDELICSNCSDQLNMCVHCEKYIYDSENECMSVHDGVQVTLCDSCFDNQTFKCKECNQVFYDEQLSDNESDYCSDCEEKISDEKDKA